MSAGALKFRHEGSLAAGAPWSMLPAPRHPLSPAVDLASRAVPADSDEPYAELLSLDQVSHHRAAWEALIARALEPNVFIEPAFALAAARHFAIIQRPRFLLVWSPSCRGLPRTLIGLCLIASAGIMDAGLARGWVTRQAALGTPLLDREQASAALEAMLRFAASRLRRASLLLQKIPQEGATNGIIRAMASAKGHELRMLAAHRRAYLSGGTVGAAALQAGLPAKRRKELRRQRRRLDGGAGLELVSARRPDEIRQAVEYFLRLEARGWKGAGGTALLCDPGETAFLRTATRGLAEAGKCRIDMLMRGDAPAAMAIVLESGGHAAFWKIAFDEAFASYSPGLQLTLELSRLQVGDATVAMTDSCAIAGHPMIDRVWPERLAVTDMLIATRPGHAASFGLAHARVALGGRLREAAKAAYCRLKQT